MNRLALAFATLAAAGFYAAAYLHHPHRPGSPAHPQGWWVVGWDQPLYLRAAAAWAAGNLDPAEHWYLPGYPLLAAPFAYVTPANPFLLPNLALLLASLWLTAALAARLAPRWPLAPGLGAAVFLGTSVLPPAALDAWVTPWTTTPTAALTLGCLLAAATLAARLPNGRLAWPAFTAALCGAGVALFRPIDAAVLLCAVGAALLIALARHPPGARTLMRAALAAAAGGALAGLLLAVPYVAVHGWHRSAYVVTSANIGFEWRLIPLRWATIVLSPRPWLPEGSGLVEVFPWIVPGLAGVAACLASPPAGGARALHAAVAAAVAGQVLLYLAYRDLHAPGLWAFGNNHYLKWVLPLLGVYALLLAGTLRERRRWGALAGAGALLALLPWRAELALEEGGAGARVEAGALMLPSVRLGTNDAILVPANGSRASIYFGEHRMRIGASDLHRIADFKTFPVPGGLMITPLRPLPAGPVVWTPGAGVTLATDPAPRMARQRVVFGQPCWLAPRVPACRFGAPIPPRLPLDVPLSLAPGAERYLREGWAYLDPPGGRWTVGTRAALQFVLDPAPAGPLLLAVEGNAIAPPGHPPLAMRLLAGGATVGAWQIDRGDVQVLEATLPPGFGADGRPVTVALEFDNPRRPHDVSPPSTDMRPLGLFVRSVTVRPAPVMSQPGLAQ